MQSTIDPTGWTKLAVVVLVTVAASILGYGGKIDSQAVVALLSAALGYVFGNGHGILSAAQVQTQKQATPDE
jgi:hypothetical protein